MGSRKEEPVVVVEESPWRVAEWFPELDKKTLSLLHVYRGELIKFNRALSLISGNGMANLDFMHFADCISACGLIAKDHKAESIVDIGSGNGFPGIVYAILYPGTKVKLVDIDERKCEFLKSAAHTIGLKNIEVIRKQIEAFSDNSIDVALTRGFSSISKAVLKLRKPFKVGGRLYHLKSDEWATEVANIPAQLCTHWRPRLVGDYKLPVGSVKFAVVVTEKISD